MNLPKAWRRFEGIFPRAFLEEMTKRSLFRVSIHWLGPVEDLQPWYCRVWVVTLASENESFDPVLVEAMGSGIPVISNQLCGTPEIAQNSQKGILVSPRSSEQLADPVKRLLNEKYRRNHIPQAALRAADSFALELHNQNVLHIFSEVCRYA